MWKRTGLVLGAVAASLVVTGAGNYQPATIAPENADAAKAVKAITDGGAAALASIPADFADVMGYAPAAVTDSAGTVHAVKPDGTCSVPFGAFDMSAFELECKTHDLGYDLLRYAARSGGELGPWARQSIDDQFTAAVDARAEIIAGGSAQVTASLADAGVRFNSWRQGDGVPTSENGWPYAVAGLMIGAALVGPPVASRVAQRQRAASKVRLPAAVTAR